MSDHPHEKLSAYFDHMLPSAEARAIAAHVRTCAACRAELSSMHKVHQHLAALPPLALRQSPQAFWNQVRQQLEPQTSSLGWGWLWGILLPPLAVLTQSVFILATLVGLSSLLGFSLANLVLDASPLPLQTPSLPATLQFILQNSLLGQLLTSSIVAILPLALVAAIALAVVSLFLGSVLASYSSPSRFSTS